jgi:hypothetical protein
MVACLNVNSLRNYLSCEVKYCRRTKDRKKDANSHKMNAFSIWANKMMKQTGLKLTGFRRNKGISLFNQIHACPFVLNGTHNETKRTL